MSEESQTVFQAVITVNCVNNSPLRGRLHSYDEMETEHMALLCYCETRWLSCAEVHHRTFEMKEEINNDDANLCYNEDFI
jgi:hypothetical protein